MRTIVFDTETTGLPLHAHAPLEAQPHIIEFAAIVLEDGEPAGDGTLLIHPGMNISPEITRITGLKDEDLKGKPNFRESLPRIRQAFRHCDQVIAHNLRFDKMMLFFELARIGCEDFDWPTIETCTVETYQELFGFYPKLTYLYQEKIGIPLIQTHRAMDDVKALVQIVQKEKLWKR